MAEKVKFAVPEYDPNLLAEYRKEFELVDHDGNKKLDKKEFIQYLIEQGQPSKMAKLTYEIVDINHDGSISFDEFAEYINAACKIVQDNDVNAYLFLVFKSCDRKKTGSLDLKGFKKFMKFMDTPLGFFEAKKKFKKFDSDGSGSIDFKEIMQEYQFEMSQPEKKK